ncbi:hypothetical protein V1507DRAFT_395373, partial [Lipomyces tetrasporus]
MTITTIDQRRIDLGTENVRIYRVRGRIPAFGDFEAETIELPLGPDTDLVLGADWMGEVGLLDSIAKKLGIVTASVEGAGSKDDDRNADDKEDYEDRQEAINDMTMCASVKVDRRWTPFQPREQRSSPVNFPSPRQTEQEDLKVELASAMNEAQKDATPRIPEEYADFSDIFAGTTSADDFKLPPHRAGFDHAIELLPGKTPPNRPQFHQSELELAVTKKQIEAFLQKGLIRVSQSP